MAFLFDVQGLLVLAVTGIIAYVTATIVYRLYFHPLAHIPGPKVAAITYGYEFYWDVIQSGQLINHLPSLHKKYGRIIRITPNEVHILDSSFYDELYARAGAVRRHKSPRQAGRFAFAEESFSSWHHDVHKMRRGAINPFFSSAKIIKFQPVIRKKLSKLSQVLMQSHEKDDVLNLYLGYTALTGDIATEFAFARSYDQLDSAGFQASYDQSLKAVFMLSNFNIHFPYVLKIFNALPRWITAVVNPVVLPVVDFWADSRTEISDIRNGLNEGHQLTENPTLFHEMLTTKLLPDYEKTDKRLGDEAVEIIAAGIVTTAWASTVGSFHIVNNPEILSKLRAELKQHIPDALNLRDLESNKSQIEWRALEPLVYLSSCVKESIRISGGVVARSPRILPDQDLKYGNYVIPRGNEVSMSTWHISNDPEIFPQPTLFKPERWMTIDPSTGRSSKNTDMDRFLVAFGKGNRQCAGMNLAYAELYLALAVIFRSFDMELYETDVSDARVKHAYLVPYPKLDSKGVRVKVKGLVD